MSFKIYRFDFVFTKKNILSIFLGAILSFVAIFSVIDNSTKSTGYITGQYSPVNILSITSNMASISASTNPGIQQALTDWSLDTFWLGQIIAGVKNTVSVRLYKPTDVGKISIGYGVGRAPLDYCLIGYYGSKEVLNICPKNNHSEWLTYYPPKEIVLTKIDLIFNKTSSDDGLQQISEMSLFERLSSNFVIRYFDNFFRHERSLPSFIYYVALISLIVVLTGSVALNVISQYIPLEERMVWVFACGTVLLGFIASISIMIPSIKDGRTFILLCISILIGYSIVFKTYRSIKVDVRLLFLVFFYMAFLIGYFYFFNKQQLNRIENYDHLFNDTSYYSIPYGSYEQDFETPYGEAKVLLYGIPGNTNNYRALMGINRHTDRTPLFSLVSISFLGLFGDRFFIFEILSLVFMVPVILSTYLLLKKLFNKSVAWVSLLIILANHFLLFVAHFSQVKILSTTFIGMFYLYLIFFQRERRPHYLWMISVMGSLAVLVHPFAIIYILAGIPYLTLSLHRHVTKIKVLLMAFFLPLAIILLWMSLSFSNNRAALIGSHFSGSINETSTANTVNSGVMDRFYNFLGLFLTNPKPFAGRSFSFPRLTLIGAVTIVMFPLILIGLITKWKLRKREISYLLVGVVLLSLITNGYYVALGIHWYLVGLIPILIGFGVSVLNKFSKYLQGFIMAFVILESAYVSFYTYHFDVMDKIVGLYMNNFTTLIMVVSIIALWYLGLFIMFIMSSNK